MTFREYLDKNNVKTDGCLFTDKPWDNLENIVGQEIWICDYRLNSEAGMTPIRSIPPKLVRVMSNDDLPKGKNIYYSDVHFREIKNGKVSSTIIAPYDRTGYRGYAGISVSIFMDEKSCVKQYKKFVTDAMARYQEEANSYTEKVRELETMIANL